MRFRSGALWPFLLLAGFTACGSTDAESTAPEAESPDAAPETPPPPDLPDPDTVTVAQIRELPAGAGGPPNLEAIEPQPLVELPDIVHLKSNWESYNRMYYFAVRDGHLWVKPNVEMSGVDGPWEPVQVPPEIAGRIAEISTDDYELIALTDERQIWVMVGTLGPLELATWKSKWGFPFGDGPGFVVPGRDEIMRWEWVSVSAADDKCRPDIGGNCHSPGAANVSHVWMLFNDGQRLRYNDPWLPRDYSYGMCTPVRGRTKAVGLSGSGSHEFVISALGDMYTRLYDFDLSGANTVFVQYSYEPQAPGSTVHQLPVWDWVKHPKIRGRITDHVSLMKVGENSAHRTMRVEGVDAEGHTGFFEKDITELSSDAWTFHQTDAPLRGRWFLDNRDRDSSLEDLGESRELDFSRNMDQITVFANTSVTGDGEWAAEILHFNPYCSPATLRIHFGPDDSIDLVLHSVDGLRVVERAEGLDDTMRAYNASVEVSDELLGDPSALSDKARAFLALYLGDRRFTTAIMQVSDTELQIGADGWFAPWVLRRVTAGL